LIQNVDCDHELEELIQERLDSNQEGLSLVEIIRDEEIRDRENIANNIPSI